MTPMPQRYRVEIEQEENGRFLAEVVDLPGVMAYGETAETALTHAQALALRVLADRLEHGEWPAGPVSVSFETSSAAA
jgi:predicted RNase H-like HicB family nuclease